MLVCLANIVFSQPQGLSKCRLSDLVELESTMDMSHFIQFWRHQIKSSKQENVDCGLSSALTEGPKETNGGITKQKKKKEGNSALFNIESVELQKNKHQLFLKLAFTTNENNALKWTKHQEWLHTRKLMNV